MRVFCPTCQEPVTIADDLAGKATFCPLCKAAFTAPTLFSSTPATPGPSAPAATDLSTPVPIPSLSLDPTPPPSHSATSQPPSRSASSTPVRSGYARAYGFSFAPEIVQWLAPVCLGLAVILTLFSWDGAYPGGHAVYTQSAWGALFGGFSTDPVGEQILRMNPEKTAEGELRLRDRVSWNPLMLLFLPLLLLAFVLAVIFTAYPMLKMNLPPQLTQMVPYGMAIVTGLALLVTLILFAQSVTGFSLENALVREARSKAVKVQVSNPPTEEELRKQEIAEGQAVGGLHIRHTDWLCLEFTCLIIATLTAALAFIMTRRTDRPHPRIEVMW
ncbi:MAG: hypothetical protein ACJ8F7_03005 [Gemmataceae bacterium]